MKVQVGWFQANQAKAAVRRDCCVLILSCFFLSSFCSASLSMVSTRISSFPLHADLSWSSSRPSCSMAHFTNPAAPVHSSGTSDHLLTELLVHTHTHICTCTCSCIYHSQSWLRGPHSGGEPPGGNKTFGPISSGDTRLISTAACPLSAVGYSSMGF